MKTIIAGGRDYRMTKEDFRFLDNLKPPITEVISGGARGADTGGFAWGWSRRIPVTTIVPDWKNLGPSAGPRRNRQMAMIAERVVLFPGGRGTAAMRREAEAFKLVIVDRFPSANLEQLKTMQRQSEEASSIQDVTGLCKFELTSSDT